MRYFNKSVIKAPFLPGGWYIKTINKCVSPALNKTDTISMGGIIGNSSTKEILKVW